MSRSLRYKEKNYSQSKPVLWKRYLLLVVCGFMGGGLSVLGYYFFSVSQKTSVPVVQGYDFPVRTYVAPQEEKNVQKIYDLDQEEAPIVEKILPYQDFSKTPGEKKSDPDSNSQNLSTESSSNSYPKDKNSLEESCKRDEKKKASSDGSALVKEVSPNLLNKQPPSSSLEKKEAAPVHLEEAKKPSLSSCERAQIGPVFSDLAQAKEFLIKLKAKAEGYDFVVQCKAAKGKKLYRVVTKKALTPQEIKKLLKLTPSL
ncbi:hypothetical protein HE1_01034 [Holospora elegans E1]|uniref:Uncharacterized protein n=1 Tax=Holospora elegans E1 TaxID=1427503 RepID=A0A023E000_9PROT|nr:hypothetical protein [Holospora elegans]GAJ46695.1 hypothetical protein HE1_01034 [Holospora elegans E1]